MAVYANTNMQLLVGGLAVSGFASSATIGAEVAEIDVTTIGSAGWRNKIPGLGSHTLEVEGFQDFAAGSLDELFTGTSTAQSTWTFAPTNGGATLADPCVIGTGRTTTRTQLRGAVGDAAGFSWSWAGTERVVRGQIIHPLFARTTTGNGTATAQTFTTGASLYAAVHVTSVSGAGSITFTIQTDDAVGFPSATTRYTFGAITAVGGAWSGAVTGIPATETHVRVGYTISGFTSVTFAAACGVI